jgi:hypothetical protein
VIGAVIRARRSGRAVGAVLTWNTVSCSRTLLTRVCAHAAVQVANAYGVLAFAGSTGIVCGLAARRRSGMMAAQRLRFCRVPVRFGGEGGGS